VTCECGVSVPADKFSVHQEECGLNIIQCTLSNYGCTWKGQLRTLQTHLANCRFSSMSPRSESVLTDDIEPNDRMDKLSREIHEVRSQHKNMLKKVQRDSVEISHVMSGTFEQMRSESNNDTEQLQLEMRTGLEALNTEMERLALEVDRITSLELEVAKMKSEEKKPGLTKNDQFFHRKFRVEIDQLKKESKDLAEKWNQNGSTFVSRNEMEQWKKEIENIARSSETQTKGALERINAIESQHPEEKLNLMSTIDANLGQMGEKIEKLGLDYSNLESNTQQSLKGLKSELSSQVTESSTFIQAEIDKKNQAQLAAFTEKFKEWRLSFDKYRQGFENRLQNDFAKKSDITTLSSDVKTQFDTTDDKINSVNEQISSLNRLVTAVDELSAKSEKSILDVRAEIKKRFETERQTIKKFVESKMENVRQTQEQRQSIDSQIATVKELATSQNENLKELVDSNVKNVQKLVDDVKQSVESKVEDVKQTQSKEIQSLGSKLEELRVKHEQSSTNQGRLESQIENVQVESKIESLRQSVKSSDENRQSQIESLRQSQEKTNSSVRQSLDTVKQSLESQLESLRDRHEKFEKSNANDKQSHEDAHNLLESQIKALRQLYDKTEKSNDNARQSLEIQIESLKQSQEKSEKSRTLVQQSNEDFQQMFESQINSIRKLHEKSEKSTANVRQSIDHVRELVESRIDEHRQTHVQPLGSKLEQLKVSHEQFRTNHERQLETQLGDARRFVESQVENVRKLVDANDKNVRQFVELEASIIKEANFNNFQKVEKKFESLQQAHEQLKKTTDEIQQCVKASDENVRKIIESNTQSIQQTIEENGNAVQDAVLKNVQLRFEAFQQLNDQFSNLTQDHLRKLEQQIGFVPQFLETKINEFRTTHFCILETAFQNEMGTIRQEMHQSRQDLEQLVESHTHSDMESKVYEFMNTIQSELTAFRNKNEKLDLDSSARFESLQAEIEKIRKQVEENRRLMIAESHLNMNAVLDQVRSEFPKERSELALDYADEEQMGHEVPNEIVNLDHVDSPQQPLNRATQRSANNTTSLRNSIETTPHTSSPKKSTTTPFESVKTSSVEKLHVQLQHVPAMREKNLDTQDIGTQMTNQMEELRENLGSLSNQFPITQQSAEELYKLCFENFDKLQQQLNQLQSKMGKSPLRVNLTNKSVQMDKINSNQLEQSFVEMMTPSDNDMVLSMDPNAELDSIAEVRMKLRNEISFAKLRMASQQSPIEQEITSKMEKIENRMDSMDQFDSESLKTEITQNLNKKLETYESLEIKPILRSHSDQMHMFEARFASLESMIKLMQSNVDALSTSKQEISQIPQSTVDSPTNFESRSNSKIQSQVRLIADDNLQIRSELIKLQLNIEDRLALDSIRDEFESFMTNIRATLSENENSMQGKLDILRKEFSNPIHVKLNSLPSKASPPQTEHTDFMRESLNGLSQLRAKLRSPKLVTRNREIEISNVNRREIKPLREINSVEPILELNNLNHIKPESPIISNHSQLGLNAISSQLASMQSELADLRGYITTSSSDNLKIELDLLTERVSSLHGRCDSEFNLGVNVAKKLQFDELQRKITALSQELVTIRVESSSKFDQISKNVFQDLARQIEALQLDSQVAKQQESTLREDILKNLQEQISERSNDLRTQMTKSLHEYSNAQVAELRAELLHVKVPDIVKPAETKQLEGAGELQ
jgi:hypothetical protein